jgi:outer membrane assembly lipoprotein YfiO
MKTPFFRLLTAAFAIFFSFGLASAEAAWIWSPDLGKWINPKKAAKDTPEEQYDWALQFFTQKDWDRAIEEFEKLTDSFPTSRLAAEGVYYAGQAYEQKGDPAKAADAYQKLVDRYPYSDRIKDAMRREFEIANDFAKGEKVKVLGMAVLPGQEKALELYNHIVKNAPYGSFGDQAQFKIGELYKKQGEYDLSKKAFQTLVDEYPNSELITQARYEIARSSMLASSSAQYDEKDAEKALEDFQDFKQQFADKPQALEADESIRKIRAEKAERAFDVAEFYEKQKKWKSAKVYYQELVGNYPETPAAAKAQKRLERVIREENEPAGGFKVGMPKIGMPSLPKPKLPELHMPKIGMPKIGMPKWPGGSKPAEADAKVAK